MFFPTLPNWNEQNGKERDRKLTKKGRLGPNYCQLWGVTSLKTRLGYKTEKLLFNEGGIHIPKIPMTV